MRRVFAAVLAIACVAGSTPVFARGFAHGAGAYARVTTSPLGQRSLPSAKDTRA
jgi:hypothetical protein